MKVGRRRVRVGKIGCSGQRVRQVFDLRGEFLGGNMGKGIFFLGD